MIEQWEDEYGKWGRDIDGDLYHLERSKKWHDENPTVELPKPEPSPTDKRFKEHEVLIAQQKLEFDLAIVELYEFILN